MAIETPRKEILRRIGIRPGYVDKLFDHELSDERNARGADWRGWDGSTNVLIVGANGSGKSMLAVEMLLRAWRRGVLSLAMLQLPELMDEHFGDSKGPRTLRDLALRARIAVLDEFGRGRAASVYAAGLAAEIVELRMGFERPTIILSNLPLQGPEASIESLDSALYDRMARGSLIIELAGDSLRGTK
jgi:DNA replication protein DnaC